jgi:hypothetical protein
LNLPDNQSVAQLDLSMRLAGYHRLELSYSTIDRSGESLLPNDLDFGDEKFLAGSLLQSSIKTQMLRLSYGYSLLMDSQKELGVTAGLHQTRIEARILVSGTGQEETSNPTPLLPVIGMYGSVSLGAKTTLSADVQIFRMNFDRYEGSLNYARLELQHLFGRLGLGVGYSYYAMNLDSSDEDLTRSLQFRHHGPAVFVTFRF